MTTTTPQVVIIGGGFGGLRTAQKLRRIPVKITLIDRRNFHLFQPLLYQVATGALSPADITAPLRGILKRNPRLEVLLNEVVGVDVEARLVLLRNGQTLSYDLLVISTGANHHYFGNEQWESVAPGLKTLEDAIRIRRQILEAFEKAEWESDPQKQLALLRFAVVGAGPTGVELAGAIAEIARYTLRKNFRHINPADSKIYLIEGSDRVLRTYDPKLAAKAHQTLEKMGVTILLNTIVTDVQPDCLMLKSGDTVEKLEINTVIWGAGVKASPLGQRLAEATGAELDKLGRIMVEPDLTIKNHPDIFVIGDLANFSHGLAAPLPGQSPVARQEGAYVARTIGRRLRGKTTPPFRYLNLGQMATIGRAAAIAEIRFLRLSGFLGWAAWLFIHLMSIVDFKNRILIFIQWMINYFTRDRSARLITYDAYSTHSSLNEGEKVIL